MAGGALEMLKVETVFGFRHPVKAINNVDSSSPRIFKALDKPIAAIFDFFIAGHDSLGVGRHAGM